MTTKIVSGFKHPLNTIDYGYEPVEIQPDDSLKYQGSGCNYKVNVDEIGENVEENDMFFRDSLLGESYSFNAKSRAGTYNYITSVDAKHRLDSDDLNQHSLFYPQSRQPRETTCTSTNKGTTDDSFMKSMNSEVGVDHNLTYLIRSGHEDLDTPVVYNPSYNNKINAVAPDVETLIPLQLVSSKYHTTHTDQPDQYIHIDPYKSEVYTNPKNFVGYQTQQDQYTHIDPYKSEVYTNPKYQVEYTHQHDLHINPLDPYKPEVSVNPKYYTSSSANIDTVLGDFSYVTPDTQSDAGYQLYYVSNIEQNNIGEEVITEGIIDAPLHTSKNTETVSYIDSQFDGYENYDKINAVCNVPQSTRLHTDLRHKPFFRTKKAALSSHFMDAAANYIPTYDNDTCPKVTLRK